MPTDPNAPCPGCRGGFLCDRHRLWCFTCGDVPSMLATVLEPRGLARYASCPQCIQPFVDCGFFVEAEAV